MSKDFKDLLEKIDERNFKHSVFEIRPITGLRDFKAEKELKELIEKMYGLAE
jgi:hypothetical protein